jgi:hypothetical protein
MQAKPSFVLSLWSPCEHCFFMAQHWGATGFSTEWHQRTRALPSRAFRQSCGQAPTLPGQSVTRSSNDALIRLHRPQLLQHTSLCWGFPPHERGIGLGWGCTRLVGAHAMHATHSKPRCSKCKCSDDDANTGFQSTMCKAKTAKTAVAEKTVQQVRIK